MGTQPPVDEAKQEKFAGKIMDDLAGAMAVVMCSLGDRLGLFKDLAANGAATIDRLADRNGIDRRYAQEWLGGMAAAGYLEYDPASGLFSLPPEHAPALADEDGPKFAGGMYQMMPSMFGALGLVLKSFRDGGGVPQSAYDPDMWDGLERFTAPRFENFMLQQWIPALPEVQAKLERGASVADVGCGRGRALIKLAEAFPNSRYAGYDAYGPTIEQAAAKAQAAGVAERVTFSRRDVSQGLPEQYDIITTFDVIHDSADPLGLLRTIRKSLKEDGIYLLMDINCADKFEDNTGPLSTVMYGSSIMYCMTSSLASGGAGLGTLGFPESKAKELCAEAGFSSVRLLPLDNPFNNLYEVRP